VTAYYECFHERLQFISATEIEGWGPGVWESGHPDIEPYFNEYLPLLQQEGGIAGFEQSMAFDRFFPAKGYDGALSRLETAYINRLIAGATRLHRTACLTCKRSLGRVHALKRFFGGTHIVLQRKLLPQWHSYREQARLGNSYFLDTVLRTIALNQQEPFIALLGDFVRTRPGGSADIASSKLDTDDHFVAFVALHFYLYLLTSDDSDVVIRTSELPDPDYRHTTEKLLRSCTGLTIDLSDAREWTVAPGDLLHNVEKVRRRIDEFCDWARRSANKSISQAEACRPLLKDLYESSIGAGRDMHMAGPAAIGH